MELSYKNQIIKSSKEVFNRNGFIEDGNNIFFEVFEGDITLGDDNQIRNNVYFQQLLTSRRQVNRFINQLKISILNIKNEEDIIFNKYILFQLLIFKFPIFKTYLNENYLYKILKIDKEGLINYDNKRFNDFIESEKVLLDNVDKLMIENLLIKIFTLSNSEYEDFSIENNDICLFNYFPIYYNQNIYTQVIDLSQIKLSIKNLALEMLYDSYKDKPHFDKNIFKNICLINENYSNIEQILSFVNLIKNNALDNISIMEIIFFINKFDNKYYPQIFELLFNDENIKNNKVVINYLKFFVLIYSEVNKNSFTMNSINLQHISTILESNKDLKKYLSKEVILKNFMISLVMLLNYIELMIIVRLNL